MLHPAPRSTTPILFYVERAPRRVSSKFKNSFHRFAPPRSISVSAFQFFRVSAFTFGFPLLILDRIRRMVPAFIMKRSLAFVLSVMVLGTICGCSPQSSSDEDPSSAEVSLFDGQSLAGWDIQAGEEKWWHVNDGVIEGGSLEEKVPHNTFITLPRTYQNFELILKIRLIAGEGEGFRNSGIQIRSQRLPDHHEMLGYQVDAGIGWWGKLYDESRRRMVIAEPVDEAALEAVVHDWDDWNEYRILAEGPRIQSWINGVAAVDYTEKDTTIPLEGLIGLQAHSGAKFVVQFKDLRIRELAPSEGTPTWAEVELKAWPKKN